METEEKKNCRICNIIKNIDEFQFRKDNQKYRTECKECVSNRNKEMNYSQKSRKKKKKEKLGIVEEKEEFPKNMKRCIKCNEIKSLDEFWFREDNQKHRNQCKRCRQNKVNQYKRENEEYKKRFNSYCKKRRETDIQYMLSGRLRSRLRKMLITFNTSKSQNTFDLLGCDIQFFKQYIEERFREGMSWEKRNFHIDHIIPCTAFDLTKEEEQKKCFHYTNLQPLFPIDNIKKGNKIL